MIVIYIRRSVDQKDSSFIECSLNSARGPDCEDWVCADKGVQRRQHGLSIISTVAGRCPTKENSAYRHRPVGQNQPIHAGLCRAD